MFSLMLPKILCFLDTETTGLKITRDRIIEIGILRVENGKLTKIFKSFVNPGVDLPPEITTISGITAKDLENAPTFRQIKQDIREILDDAVMVAHNVRFDYSFLKNEFRRLEESFNQKHFCSMKLARKLFPKWKHHSLDMVIENMRIKCKKRHRALDDAKVLHHFYRKIQKQFSPKVLQKAINLAMKRPTLPMNLKPADLDNLPETPGVYIFYGKSGAPLYIGKSVNIRERVLSHFSSDHSHSFEMKISQQVQSIEAIQTKGNLGALILESRLIKKLLPLYNRKLRVSRKAVLAKEYQTKEGYKGIVLEEADYIDPSQMGDILSVFKSKKQAKELLIQLAEEKNLCEKLLGLEKSRGACFNYRLGRCFGACLGKEKILKYNLRFWEALSRIKLKPWPYKGPIRVENLTIDKWCLKGQPFDLDTYNILLSHLT